MRNLTRWLVVVGWADDAFAGILEDLVAVSLLAQTGSSEFRLFRTMLANKEYSKCGIGRSRKKGRTKFVIWSHDNSFPTRVRASTVRTNTISVTLLDAVSLAHGSSRKLRITGTYC